MKNHSHTDSNRNSAESAVWKSQLSEPQRWLLERMQELCYGHIEELVVVKGQPLTDPPPRIFSEFRLGSGNQARPENALKDFKVKRQVLALFEAMKKIGNGKIYQVQFRDGLPYKMRLPALGGNP